MLACIDSVGLGQGTSPELAKADLEAVEFVEHILAQHPTKEVTVEGVFQIRRPDSPRRSVPVKLSIQLADQGWRSVYQTSRTDQQGPEQLIIQHRTNQPNQYLFTQISLDGTRTNAMTLTGSEAALSFAGTDFWLSDLGLEFLHWPDQHMVRNPRINMRWGRPLKVIESINPRPSEGHYARVVSEIDSDLGNVIRAQAYDLHGKRFKVFDLKSFKKVNGRWQVKDMELRNDLADSKTILQFGFETE